jgi:heme/copper-type cytochrome/quinol oxidase subunit 3
MRIDLTGNARRTTMTTPELRVYGKEPPKRTQVAPNAVLGVIMFIGVELMLFAGLMSAFVIVKANFAPGMWPPPGQPRLPVVATAFTTVMLLGSGVALWKAGRQFKAEPSSARTMLAVSLALGAAFVGIQGVEWTRLLAEGLTMQSSPYGAFFYLIVGAHASHAVPALVVLAMMLRRLQLDELDKDTFAAGRLFWYFVVLVWPVLYWKVYL